MSYVGIKVKPLIQIEDESIITDTKDTHDTHILRLVTEEEKKEIKKEKAETRVSSVSSVSATVCGNCQSFHTGACEFPSGPDAVQPSFAWAVNCRGYKPKTK